MHLITSDSPADEALRMAKAALDLPWVEALVVEERSHQRVIALDDRAKGNRAFNEKRKPRWSGS